MVLLRFMYNTVSISTAIERNHYILCIILCLTSTARESLYYILYIILCVYVLQERGISTFYK